MGARVGQGLTPVQFAISVGRHPRLRSSLVIFVALLVKDLN